MVDIGAPAKSRRIAGLDGVRALACFAVMGFHAHVPGFSSGWLGVDVFFVLAGFLTVQQLGRDGASAAIWLYRRWARLFPALVVMVAVVGPIAVLGGADVRLPLAASVFVYWPWIAGGSGGLFGHVWSITVEICGYALAAALVFPIVRRDRIRVPSGALLAGIAALLLVLPWHWLDLARPYGFILGLAIGLLPLGPVLPALRSVGAVLGTRFLAGAGLRTYSLYLWHLPIFLLLANHSGLRGMPLLIGQFTVAGLAAELSYRLVEGPSRKFLYSMRFASRPAASRGRPGTSRRAAGTLKSGRVEA